MKIKIRRGEKSDLPQVLTLIKELALYERAPKEVTLTIQEFEKDFRSKHPLFHFFVAENESAKNEFIRTYENKKNPKSTWLSRDQNSKYIVGIALYYYGYSTWKGKRMYLDDIVVTEKMRGIGAGKKLFEEIIREAKKNNVKQIMWQVLEWNKPAINFYKKYNATLDPEWITGKLNGEQITEIKM